MERKRKMQRTGSQGSNTRFHVGSSSRGPVFRPVQPSGQPRVQAVGQGFQTPQRQIQRLNFQSPRSAPPPPQRSNNAQNTGVVGPCFSCGQSGHYANRCPKKLTNQTPAPGTNQNISHSVNNNAWVPRVSSIFPTTPADPGRKSSKPPLPASPAPCLRCRQDFTAPPPPLIISPINPLQTEP
jgi:hypothetical protein